MQLRNSICAILLLTLAQVAFATLKYAGDGRHMKASSRITKRANIFVVGFPPRIKPLPAVQPEKQSLEKRQSTCPVGDFECSDGLGCCLIGTVCVQVTGIPGCCPIGSDCSLNFGCSLSEVDCVSYCCPSGTSCSVDTQGDPSCSFDTGGGSPGDIVCNMEGYVPCTNMNGCCPTGVDCIPPNFCNVACEADDPVCGEGCCPKGQVCLTDLTCGPGDDTFTPLVTTTTTSSSTPEGKSTTVSSLTESSSEPGKPTPGTTHKTTSKKSTSKKSTSKKTTPEDTATPSGPTSFSSSQATTTSKTRSTLTRTVTALSNDAPLPTMDAMLGGALGIAAGYLAI